MHNDEWADARREVNRGAWYIVRWVIVITVIASVIGAAIWGISVLTASTRGAGDAHIQKQSAKSWIDAQARFEENYAEIVSADRKITVAAAMKAENPGDKTAEQTYLGTVNYCLSVVADYDADARNYLRGDFKAADLPDQIDLTDPNTDCKE